jgi:hypothetical protein
VRVLQESKVFFSEEKKQKTFHHLTEDCRRGAVSLHEFLVLFSEKNRLPLPA